MPGAFVNLCPPLCSWQAVMERLERERDAAAAAESAAAAFEAAQSRPGSRSELLHPAGAAHSILSPDHPTLSLPSPRGAHHTHGAGSSGPRGIDPAVLEAAMQEWRSAQASSNSTAAGDKAQARSLATMVRRLDTSHICWSSPSLAPRRKESAAVIIRSRFQTILQSVASMLAPADADMLWQASACCAPSCILPHRAVLRCGRSCMPHMHIALIRPQRLECHAGLSGELGLLQLHTGRTLGRAGCRGHCATGLCTSWRQQRGRGPHAHCHAPPEVRPRPGGRHLGRGRVHAHPPFAAGGQALSCCGAHPAAPPPLCTGCIGHWSRGCGDCIEDDPCNAQCRAFSLDHSAPRLSLGKGQSAVPSMHLVALCASRALSVLPWSCAPHCSCTSSQGPCSFLKCSSPALPCM